MNISLHNSEGSLNLCIVVGEARMLDGNIESWVNNSTGHPMQPIATHLRGFVARRNASLPIRYRAAGRPPLAND